VGFWVDAEGVLDVFWCGLGTEQACGRGERTRGL
jgi:hypothetical protein